MNIYRLNLRTKSSSQKEKQMDEMVLILFDAVDKSPGFFLRYPHRECNFFFFPW